MRGIQDIVNDNGKATEESFKQAFRRVRSSDGTETLQYRVFGSTFRNVPLDKIPVVEAGDLRQAS